MKFEMNIKRKHLLYLVVFTTMVAGIGLGVAFTTDGSGTPSIMGHSGDELDVGGATASADLDMNNNKITNVANPEGDIAQTDAVNYATLQAAAGGSGTPLIIDPTLYSFPRQGDLGSGSHGDSCCNINWRTLKSYKQDLSGAGEDVNLIFIDGLRFEGTYHAVGSSPGVNGVRACIDLTGGTLCATSGGCSSTSASSPCSFDVNVAAGKQIAMSNFEKYLYMKNFGEINMYVQGYCRSGSSSQGCRIYLDSAYVTLNYRKTNH